MPHLFRAKEIVDSDAMGPIDDHERGWDSKDGP